MRTQTRWRDAMISALVFALLDLLWVIFAPTRFGGQVAYILVNGSSMEPMFLRGDLVIVRHAVEYAPGDAIAYRNGDLRQVVFHRIVELALQIHSPLFFRCPPHKSTGLACDHQFQEVR